MMTRCGAWVMAAVLAAPVAALAHPEEQDGKWLNVDGPKQVKTFNVGPNGTLKLGNVSGDVSVAGGSGSEIRIEASVHGKGKTDAEARAQLDTVTIDMRQSGFHRSGDCGVGHQRIDWPVPFQSFTNCSRPLLVSASSWSSW